MLTQGSLQTGDGSLSQVELKLQLKTFIVGLNDPRILVRLPLPTLEIVLDVRGDKLSVGNGRQERGQARAGQTVATLQVLLERQEHTQVLQQRRLAHNFQLLDWGCLTGVPIGRGRGCRVVVRVGVLPPLPGQNVAVAIEGSQGNAGAGGASSVATHRYDLKSSEFVGDQGSV